MAINISTDINVTTGGKLTDVGQIQGAWRTVDNESDMYALTASSTTKQNLQNGMIFYVSGSNSLYTLDIAGSFPFVTYNFNSFTWPGSGGGGGGDVSALNLFTSSIQTEVDSIKAVTGSFAITGSNTFIGDQTIDGILTLTTQSSEPTYVSGGLYLDSNYNLHIGGS
jgi:hypothetical protein